MRLSTPAGPHRVVHHAHAGRDDDAHAGRDDDAHAGRADDARTGRDDDDAHHARRAWHAWAPGAVLARVSRNTGSRS